MLIAGHAPFFTSFILRTIAWRCWRSGPVTSALHTLHVLPPGESLAASGTRGGGQLTYNFLRSWCCRCTSLGGSTRLVEATGGLYATAGQFAGTFPLSMPSVGRHANVIPASGNYVNAALLGNPSTQMWQRDGQPVLPDRQTATAAALSFVLMAAILLLVSAYIRRAGTEELV
jgi:spermidine/putrescine transport system permease protein